MALTPEGMLNFDSSPPILVHRFKALNIVNVSARDVTIHPLGFIRIGQVFEGIFKSFSVSFDPELLNSTSLPGYQARPSKELWVMESKIEK